MGTEEGENMWQHHYSNGQLLHIYMNETGQTSHADWSDQQDDKPLSMNPYRKLPEKELSLST